MLFVKDGIQSSRKYICCLFVEVQLVSFTRFFYIRLLLKFKTFSNFLLRYFKKHPPLSFFVMLKKKHLCVIANGKRLFLAILLVATYAPLYFTCKTRRELQILPNLLFVSALSSNCTRDSHFAGEQLQSENNDFEAENRGKDTVYQSCGTGFQLKPLDTHWAVLVSSSRYWHNYRHSANVQSFYDALVHLGVPKAHIITMVTEGISCNARNAKPGCIYKDPASTRNLDQSFISNYKRDQVTVNSFIRVLTGTISPFSARSKRLESNEDSTVFIFLTGHGGDGYLNFRNIEEIQSKDVSDALERMRIQNRYGRLFIAVDTCQGATLFEKIHSRRVLTLAAAKRSENSYSRTFDVVNTAALIDEFSYLTTEYLLYTEQLKRSPNITDFLDIYKTQWMHSTVESRLDLLAEPLENLTIHDYFAHQQQFIFCSKSFPIAAFKGKREFEDKIEYTRSYYASLYSKKLQELTSTSFSENTVQLSNFMAQLVIVCTLFIFLSLNICLANWL